jgi:hypothetical protein
MQELRKITVKRNSCFLARYEKKTVKIANVCIIDMFLKIYQPKSAKNSMAMQVKGN